MRAQLADTLRGVICQRLTAHPRLNTRVPECEILVANDPVRGMLRKGDVFRIQSALETGRDDGMWTFARYRRWLADQTDLQTSAWGTAAAEDDVPAAAPLASPADMSVDRSEVPVGLAMTDHGDVIGAGNLAEAEPATGRVDIDGLIAELQGR
jgi:Tfp pilus assembly ATPase PilU